MRICTRQTIVLSCELRCTTPWQVRCTFTRATRSESRLRTTAHNEDDYRGDELKPHNFLSTDGRRKATLQDAYVKARKEDSDKAQLSKNSKSQPWAMGWQVSERNLLLADELSFKLKKRILAEKIGCQEEEIEQRCKEVLAVLPGLLQRIPSMKSEALQKLLENPATVAEKLLKLRAIFPTADVEQMVLRDLSLLLAKSMEDIVEAATELRKVLPEDVDLDRAFWLVEIPTVRNLQQGHDLYRLCQEYPSMLEVESFKEALSEVRRLMPQLNISFALNREPEIIFSTQRAKSMIPYDPVPASQNKA